VRPKTITLTMATADADGVCAAQTTAAAADLALNGVLAAVNVSLAHWGSAAAVTILSAGDDTGIYFEITGEDTNGLPLFESITGVSDATATGSQSFKKITKVYASGASAGDVSVGNAADADCIVTAASVSAAGVLTFDGVSAYTVTMDVPRHVSITTASDNSAITFTVVGTNRYGDALTETITGPNATTVKGSSNFATITSIRASDAVTDNVTIGSADELDSQLVVVDPYGGAVSYAVTLSSGADLTHCFKYTHDAVVCGTKDEHTATYFEDAGSATTNVDGVTSGPITGMRLFITSFVSGTVEFTILSQRAH